MSESETAYECVPTGSGGGDREAVDEPVICRWKGADPQLVLDVMPTNPDILGFSNPWYEEAISINGRSELIAEVQDAQPHLRAYIQDELVQLRAEPYFDYAVDGATASYGPLGAERASLLRGRLDDLLAP